MRNDSSKIIDYLSTHKITKLQLGCGDYILNGWLNTDCVVIPSSKEVVYLKAGQSFPIPDNSFDYIFSEHLLEHLTFTEATTMFSECYRVLKPGGVIRTATPNLQFLIDIYLQPELPIHKAYIDYLSEQSHQPPELAYAISYFHTAWGHKIIYDSSSLIRLLTKVGFTNIQQCKINSSEHSELQNIECHHKHFLTKKISYDFNQLQTMIFEGTKLFNLAG